MGASLTGEELRHFLPCCHWLPLPLDTRAHWVPMMIFRLLLGSLLRPGLSEEIRGQAASDVHGK